MKLKGKRKRISLTIDVNIRAENRGADYDERSKNKNDYGEYDVTNKKVIKQTYDGYYVKKKYGPFVVNINENLSVDDIYKYLMYLLLTKKFNITQSGEYVDDMGGILIPFKSSKTIKQKIGSLKLESYFLSKQKPIKKTW